MSDFPPRVERLREILQVGLPEGDFLVEEVWKSHKTSAYTDGYTSERFWRVSIQAGPEKLPAIVDLPDRVLLEDVKVASVFVTSSPGLIVTPRSRKPRPGK